MCEKKIVYLDLDIETESSENCYLLLNCDNHELLGRFLDKCPHIEDYTVQTKKLGFVVKTKTNLTNKFNIRNKAGDLIRVHQHGRH